MKMRFLKAATTVAMICVLVLSMTGCDALDYRDAIDLYNSGEYAQAAEIFAMLEDFEDSDRLETLCHYWIAMETMEAGDYEAAISKFEALNGYEDSDARITECTYQLALLSFEQDDLSTAESYFLQIPDYRQTPEYLRQITWQKFYDTVAETSLQTEQDGKAFLLAANPDTNQLVFFVRSQSENVGAFHNDLTVTLSRDSMIADFTATASFAMAFGEGSIGSEQTMSGRLDITTCTAETVPLVESFEKTVNDNQGNTTTSTDLADSLMTDAMLEDFRDLMTVIPELITEADFALTLHDIGFSAM